MMTYLEKEGSRVLIIHEEKARQGGHNLNMRGKIYKRKSGLVPILLTLSHQ